MLSGQTPFAAESDLALLNLHVRSAPPPLSQAAPEVSAPTVALVARLLDKAPHERPTMAEVARSLQTLGSSMSQQHSALDSSETVVLTRPRRPSEPAHPPTGAGQKLALLAQHRRRGLLTTGVVLLTCVIGVSIGALLRSGGRTGPPAATAETPSTAPSPEPTSTPRAASGTAPAARVILLLDSTPSGAAVFSAEDEQPLGQTPWRGERERGDSDLWIVLRKDGYRDRLLRLSLKQNSQRTEALSADTALAKRQRRSKGAARATRDAVDEAKRKLSAGPASSSGTDLPNASYRIVD